MSDQVGRWLVVPVVLILFITDQVTFDLLPFKDRFFFFELYGKSIFWESFFLEETPIEVRVYSYLIGVKKVAFGQRVSSLDRFSARASMVPFRVWGWKMSLFVICFSTIGTIPHGGKKKSRHTHKTWTYYLSWFLFLKTFRRASRLFNDSH